MFVCVSFSLVKLTSVYMYMCYAETKNVAVYLCKGDFTGNSDRHELTIMKGDHVSVLDKTDAGMSRYTEIYIHQHSIHLQHYIIHTYLVHMSCKVVHKQNQICYLNHMLKTFPQPKNN